MSRLLFTEDGQHLISMYTQPPTTRVTDDLIVPSHFEYQIDVWHIKTRKKAFVAKGYLIGVSKDGKSFITQVSENHFLVWNIATGQPVPLDSVGAECYATNQRSYLVPYKHGVTIRDVFDKDKAIPVIFDDKTTNIHLGSLLYGAFWSDYGHGIQGAYGNAYDINTGQMALKYPISRNTNYVTFFEVEKYGVVYIGDDYKRYSINPEIADMSSTLRPKDFLNMEMASNIGMILRKQDAQVTGIAVHPKEHWLVVSPQKKKGVLDVWNIQNQEQLFSLAD